MVKVLSLRITAVATIMDIALVWCVFALTLASVVQGTMGFGFGMTAMALLPFAISVKEASPLVVLMGLPAVIILFCTHWRHCSWRDSGLLVLGTCVGTPLGVYLLAIAPESLLMRILGAVLLAFSVRELWSSWRGKANLHLPKWSSLPIATLSGALSGAFNTGGPPLVAYLYSRPWSKEQVVAMLQLIFTISDGLRMISMIRAGLLTTHVVAIGIWAAVPVFLALLLGTRTMKRLPIEKLRSLVFAFIGMIAIRFLISA